MKVTTAVTASAARMPGSSSRRTHRLLSVDDAHNEGTELDPPCLARAQVSIERMGITSRAAWSCRRRLQGPRSVPLDVDTGELAVELEDLAFDACSCSAHV